MWWCIYRVFTLTNVWAMTCGVHCGQIQLCIPTHIIRLSTLLTVSGRWRMQGVVTMAVGVSQPGLWGELLAMPWDATVWLLVSGLANVVCTYVCVGGSGGGLCNMYLLTNILGGKYNTYSQPVEAMCMPLPLCSCNPLDHLTYHIFSPPSPTQTYCTGQSTWCYMMRCMYKCCVLLTEQQYMH